MDPQSQVVCKFASFISAQGFSSLISFYFCRHILIITLRMFGLGKVSVTPEVMKNLTGTMETSPDIFCCESRVMNHFRFPSRTSRAAAIAIIVMISREI